MPQKLLHTTDQDYASTLPPTYRVIVDTLREAVPDLIAVYLFGSAARAQEHRESDIDVAVLAEQPLVSETRWMLQERLADRLHTDVDLVDLRAASTVMRAQVLASDVVLFDADAPARQRFEMYALTMYADLNETRRAILEDIHHRGRIYGG